MSSENHADTAQLVSEFLLVLNKCERLLALVEAFGGLDAVMNFASRLGRISSSAIVPDGVTTDVDGLAAMLNVSDDTARRYLKTFKTSVLKPGSSFFVRTSDFSHGRRDQIDEQEE